MLPNVLIRVVHLVMLMLLTLCSKQWWIDGPSGAGLYVLQGASGSPLPPKSGWVALNGVQPPVPEVHVIEQSAATAKDEL